MKKTDIRNFIFKNIGIILTIAMSLLYIFKGFYSLEESGKTVFEIIGDGAMSAIFGFAVAALLRQTGFNYGNDDIELINARSLHSKKIDKISPYMNLLDEFCKEENIKNQKEMRSKILAPRGLRYEDFFTPEGVFKGEYPPKPFPADKARRKAYRLDMKAVLKAQRLELTPLATSSLTSERAEINDKYNFKGDEREYAEKRNKHQSITKLACAVVFGYYVLRFSGGSIWQDLLWPAFQVVLYLTLGAIEMLDAYMFMRTDKCGSILRKIDVIDKFYIYAKEKTNEQEIVEAE